MKKLLCFSLAIAVLAGISLAADEAIDRIVTVKAPAGRAIFVQITEAEFTAIDFEKAFAADWPELAGSQVKLDWQRIYGIHEYLVQSANPTDAGTPAGYLVPVEFLVSHPGLMPTAWQELPPNTPRSPWSKAQLNRVGKASSQAAVEVPLATEKKATPRFNK